MLNDHDNSTGFESERTGANRSTGNGEDNGIKIYLRELGVISPEVLAERIMATLDDEGVNETIGFLEEGARNPALVEILQQKLRARHKKPEEPKLDAARHAIDPEAAQVDEPEVNRVHDKGLEGPQ